MYGMRMFILLILSACAIAYGLPVNKIIRDFSEGVGRIKETIKETIRYSGLIDMKQIFENFQQILVIRDLGEELKRIEEVVKTLREEEKLREVKPQINTQSYSCEDMVYRSPKATLVGEVGKSTIIGAILGGAAGSALSENEAEGAIVGGILGALMAVFHEVYETSDLQIESAKATAKRLGHSRGDLLRAEVKIPKNKFRKGEYVRIILRVSVLTDKGPEIEPISVTVYMLSGQTKIPMGTEEYYVELGTTPLVYQFPICGEVKPSEYKIIFEVAGVGQHVSAEGTFRVVQ